MIFGRGDRKSESQALKITEAYKKLNKNHEFIFSMDPEIQMITCKGIRRELKKSYMSNKGGESRSNSTEIKVINLVSSLLKDKL